MIDRFKGEYRFLSNFFLCPAMFEGVIYPSSENAFQAAKTLSDKKRKIFQTSAPSESKRLGRKLELRPDWNDVKDYIMYEICLDKFLRNDTLYTALLLTGDNELIEGNTWDDTYWGTVNGNGKNKLGQILMHIRATLQEIELVA